MEICEYKLLATGFKSKADKEAVKSIFNVGYKGWNSNKPYIPLFESYTEEETNNAFVAHGNCNYSAACTMLEKWVQIDNLNSNMVSLEELSAKYGISFEVFSSEPGAFCFQEHIIVKNGMLILEETTEYQEIPLCRTWNEFCKQNSKEERRKFGITDESTWNKQKKECDFIPVGGFPSWDFTITSTAA